MWDSFFGVCVCCCIKILCCCLRRGLLSSHLCWFQSVVPASALLWWRSQNWRCHRGRNMQRKSLSGERKQEMLALYQPALVRTHPIWEPAFSLLRTMFPWPTHLFLTPASLSFPPSHCCAGSPVPKWWYPSIFTLWGGHCYQCHFIDRKTEAWEWPELYDRQEPMFKLRNCVSKFSVFSWNYSAVITEVFIFSLALWKNSQHGYCHREKVWLLAIFHVIKQCQPTKYMTWAPLDVIHGVTARITLGWLHLWVSQFLYCSEPM